MNSRLSGPYVEYELWEDFEFRLRMVHHQYTSRVSNQVRDLGPDDVVEAHDLLRQLIGKFEMNWNFLYILTKKRGKTETTMQTV